MSSITLEQALYEWPDNAPPRRLAHSPGFTALWMADAEHLVLGFGERTSGRRCPLAIFAQPIGPKHVAVARVRDEPTDGVPTGLRFHFLVVARKDYEACIRDPFMLAEKVEPTWDANASLPTLTLAADTFTPRTVAQVQGVLKRIKAAALKEGEDPEAPDFERTAENSESPALLGGAQILVDGGRLVFERPSGDLRMVSGLWLLLPEATRSRLWPTSFAFSQELEFDVLVVPRLDEVVLESYTTEDQAADYPDGSYEIALQQAAEAGDQRELDYVFSKRDGRQTIRLAFVLLLLVSGLVLASRWLESDLPPVPSRGPLTVRQQQVAAAAGIVAVGDPWTSLSMLAYGKQLWKSEEKQRDAR